MVFRDSSSLETPSKSALELRTSAMNDAIDEESCAIAATSPMQPVVRENGSIDGKLEVLWIAHLGISEPLQRDLDARRGAWI